VVYTHPVELLHVSVVHILLSSQVTLVVAQAFVAGLQALFTHLLVVEQTTPSHCVSHPEMAVC
jgi:hypothetical protein